MLFAGGTISDGSSVYGGTVVSLPGARLGRGFALMGSAGGGDYDYETNGQRIDAQYRAASAALVYQSSGSWGWANFAVGPRYTHTSLSPNDPGNDRRGTRWDAGLQTDGALDGQQWRLGWFGSVGVIDGAYQARAQVTRKVDMGKWRLGVEGGVQGDPSYSRGMAGAVVGRALSRNLDLQLGAGVTFQENQKARPYLSLGISKLF